MNERKTKHSKTKKLATISAKDLIVLFVHQIWSIYEYNSYYSVHTIQKYIRVVSCCCCYINFPKDAPKIQLIK